MENLNLLNPNFFFLKDNYPQLYNQCIQMDLAIVSEKYNDSIILSKNVLKTLLKIITKSDDDLDKLLDKVCKLNSTASEIGLYLREIRMNSQRAINNSRRFSKNKALKNAEMVYEVTSYFLYDGINPLESYRAPQYYDDWVKKQKADIRALEEYEADITPINLETEIGDEENLEDEKSNRKIVIKVKTEKTPVIRIVMREDMVDEFKPVIDIDYVDD